MSHCKLRSETRISFPGRLAGALLTVYMLLWGTHVSADRYDYVWMFGFKAGLDFSTVPPTPLRSSMDALEGCASVTDRLGNLLFYTDGSRVWNRSHTVMPGGDNLTGMPYTISPTHSTSQGAIIVPVPDTPDVFYVFSLSDNAVTPQVNKGKLFYSVVDMRLDNGNGALVAGRTGIQMAEGLSEQMTTIPAEKCAVWLLVTTLDHKLKSYRISASGIQHVTDSDLLPPTDNVPENFIGKIEISTDGKILAFARRSDISLYDFNRQTGIVSGGGYISSLADPSEPVSSYSVCFSHNNSRLYANQHDLERGLYQFDLSAGSHAAIAASRVRIGNPIGGGMKRGPDGKIYYSPYNSPFLHTINNPEAPGALCGYQENALRLHEGTTSSLGFPNLVYIPLLDTQFASRSLTAPCFAEGWAIEPSRSGGWEYLWGHGDTTRESVVSGPGTYFVQYRSSCMLYIDTVHVNFRWVLPEIITSRPCRPADSTGTAFLLRANTEPYSVTWLDASGNVLAEGPDTIRNIPPGSYAVRIRNAFGCDSTLQFSVGHEGYHAAFSSDTLVCMATPVSFLNRSDPRFNAYFWDFGTGAQSSVINTEYSFPSPGRYTVRLIASNAQCADTVFRSVTVDSQHIAGPFYLDRRELCAGETISFRADSMPPDAVRIRWMIGDEESDVVTGRTEERLLRDSGMFVITYRADFRVCRPAVYTDTVQVYARPKFLSQPDSLLPCMPGSLLDLGLVSAPEEGYRYRWSTGDTTRTIIVRETGEYSLTVQSSFGCADSISIAVDYGCSVRIPNVFSPNGDGVNDYFFDLDALGNGIVSFRIKIFNRWGQLIHTADQLNPRRWDGTLNGVGQPVGVYIYTAEFMFRDGRSEQYQGNVTLLR